MNRHAHLAEVRGAGDPAGPVPGLGQGGREDRQQQGQNGNHHQQLDQAKAALGGSSLTCRLSIHRSDITNQSGRLLLDHRQRFGQADVVQIPESARFTSRPQGDPDGLSGPDVASLHRWQVHREILQPP